MKILCWLKLHKYVPIIWQRFDYDNGDYGFKWTNECLVCKKREQLGMVYRKV